jgi:hypothetical protein
MVRRSRNSAERTALVWPVAWVMESSSSLRQNSRLGMACPSSRATHSKKCSRYRYRRRAALRPPQRARCHRPGLRRISRESGDVSQAVDEVAPARQYRHARTRSTLAWAASGAPGSESFQRLNHLPVVLGKFDKPVLRGSYHVLWGSTAETVVIELPLELDHLLLDP